MTFDSTCPSFWFGSSCQSAILTLEAGVCGYGTTVGNCTQMTVQQFCANSTLKPLTFNGGINAAPQGNLGLLVLALWVFQWSIWISLLISHFIIFCWGRGSNWARSSTGMKTICCMLVKGNHGQEELGVYDGGLKRCYWTDTGRPHRVKPTVLLEEASAPNTRRQDIQQPPSCPFTVCHSLLILLILYQLITSLPMSHPPAACS